MKRIFVLLTVLTLLSCSTIEEQQVTTIMAQVTKTEPVIRDGKRN
jgi:hypothetical protein